MQNDISSVIVNTAHIDIHMYIDAKKPNVEVAKQISQLLSAVISYRSHNLCSSLCVLVWLTSVLVASLSIEALLTTVANSEPPAAAGFS